MDAPSMVQRSGDTLIVRSVVSGDQLYFDQNKSAYNLISGGDFDEQGSGAEGDDPSNSSKPPLPQCKIKRNYSCSTCTYFTQNPRHFLTHLRDIHYEKIVINECKHCLYASRHYQKLVRHMKMVHGSTDGLEEQALSRKRASQLAREQKKRKTVDVIDDTNKVPLSLVNQSTSTSSSSSSSLLLGQQQPQQQQLKQSQEYSSPSPDFPNKLLKCTICDFTTLYRIKLVNHEREEHNKTKFFRCEKCSYVTHIKARFSKHVKYHSMPMIKCIMCDFRTPYKWNLDRHMKNHGGSGPYKCAACNFTADIKQSLTVHEMNHHVPPVGHASGMNMARRKNKVGGTDIAEQYSGLQLLDADSNKLSYTPDSIGSSSGGGGGSGCNNNLFIDNLNEPLQKKIKFDILDNQMSPQTNPTDLSQKSQTQISVNMNKKTSRPIPKLIPIQHTSLGSVNLSTTTPTSDYLDNLSAFTQRDINEICAKSQNSTLKDLASLFISDEVFSNLNKKRVTSPSLSPSSNASSSVQRKSTNFFEELKETLAAATSGGKNEDNLMCQCGHLCKYVSELIIHQKHCGKIIEKQGIDYPVNLSTNSNSKTSIRCQYCRHRCKSSTDLYVHMQNCMEGRSVSDSLESMDIGSNEKYDLTTDITGVVAEDDDEVCPIRESSSTTPHPMENIVFVWNKIPKCASIDNQTDIKMIPETSTDRSINKATKISLDAYDLNGPMDSSDDNKTEDNSYYGLETAPGYGEVTKKLDIADEGINASLKKVFKCPHCSFWASTASRFHVHIVGHLNKKPFECSLCSYRSNWRWDITKHIRLKTIRDPSHKNARVLMNDETGRRNYTKYNKHITLMKVTDEDGDPKLLKSGEMTPSQEANLSFINDNLNNHLTFTKSRNTTTDNSDTNNDEEDGENDEDPDTEDDLLLNKPKIVHDNNNDSIDGTNDLSKSNTTTEQKYVSKIDEIKEDKIKDTKRTSFKCKKCNFRHSSRDIVLAHVKGHYQDSAVVSEDILDATPTLSEILSTAQLELTGNGKQTSNSSSNNNGGSSSVYRNEILSKIPLHLIAAINTLSSNVTINNNNNSNSNSCGSNNNSSSPTITIQNDTEPATTSSSSLLKIQPNDFKYEQQQHQQQSQIDSPSPNTVSGTILSTATSTDNGEVDEASSMGTMGTMVGTGWRDPAPYRCGHCHQVSNWKHVIQRHCRLKHNGDINIETIDKTNKKGIYHRLIASGNSSNTVRINLDNNTDNANIFGESSTTNSTNYPITTMTVMRHSNKPIIDVNSCKNLNINLEPMLMSPMKVAISNISLPIKATNENMEPKISSSSDISNQKLEEKNPTASVSNSITVNQTDQLIRLLNQKPLKLNSDKIANECNNSKTIECTTTEHKESLEGINEMIDKNSKLTQQKNRVKFNELIPSASNKEDCIKLPHSQNNCKLLLFCKYCPARFFNEPEIFGHLKLHASWYPYRCSACTFTSRDEHSIELHASVHTTDYIEQSKKLIEQYQIHPNYPQATHLTPIKLDENTAGTFWTVSKYYNNLKNRKEQFENNNLTSDERETENAKAVTTRALDLDDAISATKLPKKSYGNKSNLVVNPLSAGTVQQQQQQIALNSLMPFQSTMEKQIRKIQDFKKSNTQAMATSISTTTTTTTSAITSPIKYNDERCPHCPFGSAKPEILKNHMQYHICVSGHENDINCDHCDYSVSEESIFKEHIKLHFTMTPMCNVNNNNNNISFYTTYDDLVLTSVDSSAGSNNNSGCSSSSNNVSIKSNNINNSNGGSPTIDSTNYPNGGNKPLRKTIFPIECDMNECSSNKENRVLIDITTGEVFKWKC